MKNKTTSKSSQSRIDELVKEREALLYQRQENEDKMYEANSKIGTKIKKLENESYRNKIKCDDANAEIDRQVRRITKLISLEGEYVKRLAEEEKKKEQIREQYGS